MSELPPPTDRFDDGKAPDAMRTIGEVSAAFGIKPHVLRYWEQQFPMLSPLKRSGGRRLYRPDDVALVERIDDLVNRQGYTLKGAQKALKGGSATSPRKAETTAVAAEQPSPESNGANSPQVLERLRGIRSRLDAALTR
ncbi:MerR family transcriptional regulator [Aurantiacibacter sp. MUD11]|uniref:MerR family transcriptional regulator n=1 Tax=Aurantiacibacter sp. MUD11 TaxID=3003265 RepID=UPI0022AA13EC|nr:MerR family transcriptional regulator [Aurantiacibacter sp. MUD11]WAT18728.1 MerR family transcriptional regulator [Aurantiacibacter sp. MUD11]